MRYAACRSVRVRSTSVRHGCGGAEALEPRTLLAGVTVGVTPGSSGAGHALATLVDTDGGGAIVSHHGTALPINHAALSATAAAPAAGGFNLVLNKGPTLSADPIAAAALEQAASFLESVFHDPITVVIDAEIAPLGSNVLGQANSIRMGDTFDTVRNYLVSDANSTDEGFVSQLPDESGFFSTMPDSSYSISGASATRANLLALGVPASELDFGPDSEYDPSMKQDASITFDGFAGMLVVLGGSFLMKSSVLGARREAIQLETM